MNRKSVFQCVTTALAMTFAAAGIAQAQVSGYLSAYLNEEYTINSFSTTTGSFVNTFINDAGRGSTFAVSSDGTTLYMPYDAGTYGQTGVLDVVSAETGLTIQSVPLPYQGVKVVLSGDGQSAYVLSRNGANSGEQEVDVVALPSGLVTGTVSVSSTNSELLDIAVSPDGSKLFLALECANSEGCNSQQPGPCTLALGMCIYNAATLAFESQVSGLAGMLSISLDGNSLYVAANSRTAEYVLNTQTSAVSAIHMNEYAQGPPVVKPQGTSAVVFVKGSVNILDTATNTFVGKFLTSYPGGATAYSDGPGNLSAFAPDGKSLWLVLACAGEPNCTIPNGAPMALAGFEFPSGTLIGETPLQLDQGFEFVAIAFPQVLAPTPGK